MLPGVSALDKLLEQSDVERINRELCGGYRDTGRELRKEKSSRSE